MINYNPKDWFGLIFEFHKSDTMRKLMKILVVYGIFIFIITYIEINYTNFISTISVHSLVGFIIGLLLVFRTNTAYDRWWEGRKLLGSLVNTSRNLALKINAIVPFSDNKTKDFYIKMISNYCFSLKEHLRDNLKLEEIDSFHEFRKEDFKKFNHLPNKIISEIF